MEPMFNCLPGTGPGPKCAFDGQLVPEPQSVRLTGRGLLALLTAGYDANQSLVHGGRDEVRRMQSDKLMRQAPNGSRKTAALKETLDYMKERKRYVQTQCRNW